MIKIDLNKTLIELNGDEIKGSCLADVLAGRLNKGPSNDYYKFVEIAISLYKTKVLETDKSDLEKIKNRIENDQGDGCLLDFCKYQLIEEIKRQEKQPKQENKEDGEV